MKSLENSLKTSGTSVYNASVKNQLPVLANQHRTALDKTNNKTQNNQQPSSNLSCLQSVSSFFQKLPLLLPPPVPSTLPSSQLATAIKGVGEQYFHNVNEEDEEDEYEEDHNNSVDSPDDTDVLSDEKENDHDQVADITGHKSDTRRESDDGSDLLKNLITLPLLKDVLDSAARSQQGKWFELRSFIFSFCVITTILILLYQLCNSYTAP